MNLKKINLNLEQKLTLEDISGQNIYIKNIFNANSDAVDKLLKQGIENAQEYLARKKMGQRMDMYEENNIYKALVDLQTTLDLDRLPVRIECYDISHLSGKFVYGSMTSFLNGKSVKKWYRLFKTKERNNDFENLKEVLSRRFQRGLDNDDQESGWSLPDLIIIDGGKGQLSSVFRVWNYYRDLFAEYNKEFKVEICALAKSEERVYRPEDNLGVLFDGFTKFLIQRIRDETHRFGITNNRKARLRQASKTKLEEVDGVGHITAKKLLLEFESVNNLIEKLWDDEESVVKLVGPAVTNKLKKHFGING